VGPGEAAGGTAATARDNGRKRVLDEPPLALAKNNDRDSSIGQTLSEHVCPPKVFLSTATERHNPRGRRLDAGRVAAFFGIDPVAGLAASRPDARASWVPVAWTAVSTPCYPVASSDGQVSHDATGCLQRVSGVRRRRVTSGLPASRSLPEVHLVRRQSAKLRMRDRRACSAVQLLQSSTRSPGTRVM
jgi:hypothetical protein